MIKRLEQEEVAIKEKVVKTKLVKCSSCGANMKFDPDKQLLVCEHCGSSKDFKVEKNGSGEEEKNTQGGKRVIDESKYKVRGPKADEPTAVGNGGDPLFRAACEFYRYGL